jgi:hypothetical protein
MTLNGPAKNAAIARNHQTHGTKAGRAAPLTISSP